MADVQDYHWWFVARRRVLEAAINGLALPIQPKVLEIGCGTGGNLAMLSAFGQLHAIEYDDGARSIAESLGVCQVLAGGLPESIPFDDGMFDLVCMLDVLEHIEHDGEALRRASRLLKPSGYLLLTVPAYAWLWSEHDEAHHHYRRYTTEIIRCWARIVGLNVYRMGYFNSLLFPLISGVRLMRKMTGRMSGSDTDLPAPTINRMLGILFALERHVVPYTLFPFGTSVMAVLTVQSS
jgi:SAM-dependent methyltransferase